MAKNLTGTLQIVTANRLRDGAVVFLTATGEWNVANVWIRAKPQ